MAWEDAPHPVVETAQGKRWRRSKGGKITYEVIGAKVDRSYEPRYHYRNWLIVLRRLDHGTNTRPVGATTSVALWEFKRHFEVVDD